MVLPYSCKSGKSLVISKVKLMQRIHKSGEPYTFLKISTTYWPANYSLERENTAELSLLQIISESTVNQADRIVYSHTHDMTFGCLLRYTENLLINTKKPSTVGSC